jgi:hypothetical protein
MNGIRLIKILDQWLDLSVMQLCFGLNPTIIAFSPDPMVLIHFGFRASSNSTFKFPILSK